MKIHSLVKLAATTLLVFTMGTANAAIYDVVGDWDVYIPGGGTQGITDWSGSFAFSFDSSATPYQSGSIAGYDFDEFYGLNLSAFSMDPAVIGATSFTLGNVRANVFYSNGEVILMDVCGALNGDSVNPEDDDFAVRIYDPDFAAALGYPQELTVQFDISDGSMNSWDEEGDFVGDSATGSFSVSPVPLPDAAGLLGASLFGLGLVTRRQRGLPTPLATNSGCKTPMSPA